MAAAARYNAWLFERAAPYVGRRAVDVGAGIGTFTAMLADRCDHVVAVEPDPPFAQALRRRFAGAPNVEVVEDDVVASENRGTFDAIICFNVLELIADDRAALSRYRDWLRERGHLLLLVPAHPALYGTTDSALDHARRYRRRSLREKLETAGFKVRALRHVNPVGAVGWFVSSRLLRRVDIPVGPLAVFDDLVPVLRALDALRLPFGLSLWAVAQSRAR